MLYSDTIEYILCLLYRAVLVCWWWCEWYCVPAVLPTYLELHRALYVYTVIVMLAQGFLQLLSVHALDPTPQRCSHALQFPPTTDCRDLTTP